MKKLTFGVVAPDDVPKGFLSTTKMMDVPGAGIILMKEGRFLLLRGITGIWSFPKGHPEEIDRGEPLRTAVREMTEETGLQVGIDYAILGNSLRFGKRPYWLAVAMPGCCETLSLSETEHDDSGWFTMDEAAGMNGNVDVRAWVKKARSATSQFSGLLAAVSETRWIGGGRIVS